MHEPAAPPERTPSDPSTEATPAPAVADEVERPAMAVAQPVTMGETPKPPAQPADAAPAPANPPIEIVPQLTATLVGAMSPLALPPPVAVPPALLAAAAAAHAAAPPAPIVVPLAPAPMAMTPAAIAEPAAPAPFVPASTAFLVIVTTISLAADLVTKGWAKATLAGFDTKIHGQKRIEVWKHHFGFIFAQNPGGAWSFLRSLPDTLRRPFFLVVSAAAIVFIISIYQRVHREQTAMKWGLPIALGGAMGNLVDRMRYGWVIDFIDFSMKWGGREHHWPTFNVADIAIGVGVGLVVLMQFVQMRREALAERAGAGGVGVDDRDQAVDSDEAGT